MMLNMHLIINLNSICRIFRAVSIGIYKRKTEKINQRKTLTGIQRSGKINFCSQIWEVRILRVEKGSIVHPVMEGDYM